jgi:uncharacterized protein YjbI with pentapeptide repeats
VVAYRRQRLLERTAELDEGKEQREIARLFTERFTTIASQLGDDAPAVRLAGVYAMAGLADDWESQRQTCIDVLCAYLRMPYLPHPGAKASRADLMSWQREREVRHTVLSVIGSRLQADSTVSWEGCYFDFRDIVFDGGDLRSARFPSGGINFARAVFQSGSFDFSYADFSGALVIFEKVRFAGGEILFTNAKFSGSTVDFYNAEFCGSELWFDDAEFSAGKVRFGDISFDSGKIHFNAVFAGSEIEFSTSTFSGGQFSIGSSFEGGAVRFGGCKFRGVKLDCDGFFERGGLLEFEFCVFSKVRPDFSKVVFKGGELRFREPHDWSAPPIFFSWKNPPEGLELPASSLLHDWKGLSEQSGASECRLCQSSNYSDGFLCLHNSEVRKWPANGALPPSKDLRAWALYATRTGYR